MDRIDDIITYGRKNNASDVHIKTGIPTVVRMSSGLTPLKDSPWTREEVNGLIAGMLNKDGLEHFEEYGEADSSYTNNQQIRVRMNCYMERGRPGIALRIIPHPPTLESLGMVESLSPFINHKDGLVIITGPTGSGKSSTLAGIISNINRERLVHIVTIEDPVEYLYTQDKAIITQREVGSDTRDFGQALRRVLRQDPDIIVIGEARDAETMKAALSAAETGHLVFTTLHAVNVKETISRILEMFPGDEHDYIRHLLAGVLRGIVAQRLLPTSDGHRVALQEIMTSTPRVVDALKDPEKMAELDSIIEAGGRYGMKSFNQALVQLVLDKRITVETALDNSHSTQNLRLLLQQALGRDVDMTPNSATGQTPSFGVE